MFSLVCTAQTFATSVVEQHRYLKFTTLPFDVETPLFSTVEHAIRVHDNKPWPTTLRSGFVALSTHKPAACLSEMSEADLSALFDWCALFVPSMFIYLFIYFFLFVVV